MADQVAAVWAAAPKRYVPATGEIVDANSGWDTNPLRTTVRSARESYLVPNDPKLIERLPAAHLAFQTLGVIETRPDPSAEPVDDPSPKRAAAIAARGADLRRGLLQSFEDARWARAVGDQRGFLVAIARSFDIIQDACLFAAADPYQARSGPGYEARFGLTVRSALVLLICAGFVALAAVTDLPLVIAVPCYLFFGGGGLVMLLTVLSRKIALRVDAEGVTLGGSPFRYRKTTKRVPWEDIRRVVLFRQQTGYIPRLHTMDYVGLEPRPGVSVGTGSPRLTQVAQILVPQVPREVLQHCVAVNGWRLDRDRLISAVHGFAPWVEIVDAS